VRAEGEAPPLPPHPTLSRREREKYGHFRRGERSNVHKPAKSACGPDLHMGKMEIGVNIPPEAKRVVGFQNPFDPETSITEAGVAEVGDGGVRSDVHSQGLAANG